MRLHKRYHLAGILADPKAIEWQIRKSVVLKKFFLFFFLGLWRRRKVDRSLVLAYGLKGFFFEDYTFWKRDSFIRNNLLSVSSAFSRLTVFYMCSKAVFLSWINRNEPFSFLFALLPSIHLLALLCYVLFR